MSRFPWRDTSEDIAGQSVSQWETPAGAQAKADAAEAAAKDYADQNNEIFEAHIANTDVHVTPENKVEWNSKAPGSTQTALVAHTSNAIIHVTAENKTEWDSKADGITATQLAAHVADMVAHLTAVEHNKLTGISAGAQVNQNAFSQVNGASAASTTDQFFIVGGIGITVSTNPTTKTVTITATGDTAPAPHAITHVDGSDQIPDAETSGASGLMSGSDAQFVRVDGETKSGAQAKADAAQGNATDYTDQQLALITPASLGAETPAGAQAKADVVQDNLQSHVVSNVHIPHLGTTTNSGNVYSVSTTVAFVTNQKFTVKFNAASTGAATLNISTIGSAKGIKKPGGTDASLKVGVYTLFYDGTVFQLLGEGGEYGTAAAGDVRSTKTIGTDSGILNGTLVTRDSGGAVTVTPGISAQTLNAGIYDHDITVSTSNVLNVTTGSDVGFNIATERVANGSPANTPAKKYEYRANFTGTYRISFELKSGASETTMHARIYKNGTAFGADHTTNSTTYVSQTDASLAFSAGDLIQLYLWSPNTSDACFVRNFGVSVATPAIVTQTL